MRENTYSLQLLAGGALSVEVDSEGILRLAQPRRDEPAVDAGPVLRHEFKLGLVSFSQDIRECVICGEPENHWLHERN